MREMVSSDEQSIGELVASWHRATAEGNVEEILRFMAKDVVFLTPGQLPMRGKDRFEKGLRSVLKHYRIESSGEIEEVRVCGDWAYCWTRLSVTMISMDTGIAERRTGNTLSILRKEPDGNWLLARDANMLGESSEEP